MKVAIYARYSSDNQRDASIADQLRICREFAARQGWKVLQEFTDHAISGATLLRSGFQALMRDALNRRFDVVLAESLDRFSREFAPQGWQVLGLAIDGPTPVREFLGKVKVGFAIGLAGFGGTELAQALGNQSGGLPYTVLLDAQGRVRHSKMGATHAAELAEWARAMAR